ncbi:MAG TPA: tetratricopeptide repeat protein [Thermodesulfovibrionales bacterium]|nr:tetratricopeptide repeat protein [Thermodesulfovibrionales bacterium]
MPKAIKKRVAKPVKKEEDVKHIIHHARESFVERKNILLPVLIGAALLMIVVSAFFIYRSTMKTKADALEYGAYRIYYGINQKQPLQKEEQYQKALEKFQLAYDARKSAYALFYIASCYYDMGKYDAALKSLRELNERFPDDERFVPLSYYKMAMISLKKADNDGALKLLDAIANYKTGSFKDLALAESAKILEAMGKKAESERKYEELKKNFPNSPFVKTAQAPPSPPAIVPAPSEKK